MCLVFRALAASAHAILLIVSVTLLAKVIRARVQCSWSDICFESPWSLRCIVIAPLLLSIVHLALFAVTIGHRGSPSEIVSITLALLAWSSCSASLFVQARRCDINLSALALTWGASLFTTTFQLLSYFDLAASPTIAITALSITAYLILLIALVTAMCVHDPNSLSSRTRIDHLGQYTAVLQDDVSKSVRLPSAFHFSQSIYRTK